MKSIEKKLLSEIRHLYNQRLSSALNEMDVVDNKDNVVISPGLKVRHKRDGFEYTVDSIDDADPKNIRIILRVPEAPRVMPDDAAKEREEGIKDMMKTGVLEIPANVFDDDGSNSVQDVVDDNSPKGTSKKNEKLVVTKNQFEQEYEVNNQ